MLYLSLTHTDTGVFNFKNQIDSVVSLYMIDMDVNSALFGELITVTDKVPEDLFNLASVAYKL